MAKAKVRVLTGCRDCAMCTGGAFTGGGRSIRRGATNFATLGIAAAARRNCKGCGHAMEEHGRDALGGNATTATSNPARWIKGDDGRYRWWNGEHWTDYYVSTPTPDAAQLEAAKAAVDSFPPRWRQQPDGRFRWWQGTLWSNDYTRDPEGEIEYNTETAAPIAAGGASAADEIRKLAELHAAGILDDEEFAAAKKKALGL
jgi:Short C-terminal domain